MRFHWLVCALLILSLGCKSMSRSAKLQACPFVIDSEVEGVTITAPNGTIQTSSTERQSVFRLPCTAQVFRFEKACYPAAQVTLMPGQSSNHVLSQGDWESFGYLRVENDSAQSDVEVRNLPGNSLRVQHGEHAVRRLALGEYRMEVTARYKEPVMHDLKLCRADEIFILQVGTLGPDGGLEAQGGQSVQLEHGGGQLRVLTETPNLAFRISPDRGGVLKSYLEKVGVEIADIDLNKAPKAVRQAVALSRRFNSEAFRAPSSIELPAGKYFLEYDAPPQDAKRLEFEVHPDRETRLELP